MRAAVADSTDDGAVAQRRVGERESPRQPRNAPIADPPPTRFATHADCRATECDGAAGDRSHSPSAERIAFAAKVTIAGCWQRKSGTYRRHFRHTLQLDAILLMC